MLAVNILAGCGESSLPVRQAQPGPGIRPGTCCQHTTRQIIFHGHNCKNLVWYRYLTDLLYMKEKKNL